MPSLLALHPQRMPREFEVLRGLLPVRHRDERDRAGARGPQVLLVLLGLMAALVHAAQCRKRIAVSPASGCLPTSRTGAVPHWHIDLATGCTTLRSKGGRVLARDVARPGGAAALEFDVLPTRHGLDALQLGGCAA